MELYIVRHGETVWNKIHRFQGRTDIELTEYGRELARITGEALKDTPIDRIYVSPLHRAQETAALLRCGRDIPTITDERLLEMCFGEMEGMNTEEVLHDESNPFHHLFTHPELFRSARGGESFEQVCGRAREFLQQVIEPLAAAHTCDRVMIVGHGALNKALLCHIEKRSLADFWGGAYQKNCAVTIVSLENGQYRLLEDAKIFYTEQPKA